ncbi:MAG TPA: GspH/FimT family pseudopilin [Casimicrobiaceae bacterium]|nr:GspH/FimT family pseudopilin [Casimicrobiaceae bacterium]
MTSRGFTLIELLIGMVIIAILVMVALPAYTQFMGNARIRNVADSLANGMRLAQVEALRRNRLIEFVVAPGTGWTISDPDVALGGVVHSEPFSDASGQVVVDPNPAGTTKISYSGLGQYQTPTNPEDGTPVMTSIRVTHATLASPHDLRVTADPAFGIGVRVCDRRFAPPDPVGCPASVP